MCYFIPASKALKSAKLKGMYMYSLGRALFYHGELLYGIVALKVCVGKKERERERERECVRESESICEIERERE